MVGEIIGVTDYEAIQVALARDTVYLRFSRGTEGDVTVGTTRGAFTQ